MSSTRKRLRAWAAPLAFIALSAIVHFLLGAFHPNIHIHTERVNSAPLRVTLYSLAHPSPTPRRTVKPQPSPSLIPRQTPVTRSRKIKPRSARAMQAPRPPHAVEPLAQSNHANTSAATAASRPANTGVALPQPEPTATLLPAPLAAPTPIDARDMIVAAEFRHRTPPRYPEIAKDAGWQGTVMILLTIGPEGIEGTSIGSSSGYPVLDHAALTAATQSTYRSPEVNGKPAIETYRIIYTFSLDS